MATFIRECVCMCATLSVGRVGSLWFLLLKGLIWAQAERRQALAHTCW